jgi:hypothetical protein
VDPATDAARFLPFWSTREISTYAIDLTDTGYLYRGLAHGIGTTTLLISVTAILAAMRLRRQHHLRAAFQ